MYIVILDLRMPEMSEQDSIRFKQEENVAVAMR